MSEIYEQDRLSVGKSEVNMAIKNGRGAKTEFFQSIPPNQSKLAITVCGLANSGGGQVLIGVCKDGTVIGIGDINIETDVADILNLNVKRRSDFKYYTEVVDMSPEKVLFISVNGYKNLPLAAEGRFYLRHQSDDILLTPDEVHDLMS